MKQTMGAGTIALALPSWLRAQAQERKAPTLYPDSAIEIVDPRFAECVVFNAGVERLYTGRAGPRARYGLATDVTCYSATSPTIECCAGWKIPAR